MRTKLVQGIVVLVLLAVAFGGGYAWGHREGIDWVSELLDAEVRFNLFDRVETLARLRTGDESGAIELLEGAVDRAAEAVSQGHTFAELSPDAQFALQTARVYWGAYPLNGRSEELSAVLALVPLPDVEYCSPALRKLMEEARSRGVELH